MPQLRDGPIDAIDRGMPDSQWVAQQIGRPVIKVFTNIFARSLLDKCAPRGRKSRIAFPVSGDSSDANAAIAVASGPVWNLRLDQFGQKSKRLLPAKIASLGRDDVGNPLLSDVHLSSARHLLEGDGAMHRAGQGRIVEPVRIANSLVRYQFKILPTEGMALARGEVRERHLVGAANADIHVMNLTGESVWRLPLDDCVRIQERPIDPFGRSSEDTVKVDRAGHRWFSF